MRRYVTAALCAALIAAAIVGVDMAFFRHRIWERLMANVGIVLLVAAFYLRFVRPS